MDIILNIPDIMLFYIYFIIVGHFLKTISTLYKEYWKWRFNKLKNK
jgi:hypothetical protein